MVNLYLQPPMPKRLLLLFEYSAAIATLILCSGGPITVILTDGFSQGDQVANQPDFAIMRHLFLLTYVIFFSLLVLRWKKVVYVFQQSPWVLLLFLFPPISLLWSVDPGITFQRSIAIVGSGLLGVYLASRFTLKQQLYLLALTCGIIVVLSGAYALLLPKYGIMGGVHTGAWRGIYTHKNTLGKVMVLCATTFLLLLGSDKRLRVLAVLGLAASIILLVLSASKTAMINCLVMVLVIGIIHVLRLYYKVMVVALVGIVTVIGFGLLWTAVNAEDILLSLGKDVTLTGRTDIWQFALSKIQERPLLGYGYQAFWQGWGSEAQDAWLREGWRVPHAHNGFLDLALELGLIGLVCFLAIFVVTGMRRLRDVKVHVGSEHILPIVVMVYLVMANLTESSLMKRNDLLWVLFVTTSLSTPMVTEIKPKNKLSGPSQHSLYAMPPMSSPAIVSTRRRR
ncbi:MAG: O-antigen ligase [Cyanobacteria bacterium P01_B01_bin.77]